MSLLSTHSALNKVVLELPRTIILEWYFTDAYLQLRKVTRTDEYARYEYVGMTQAAAATCQQDMIDTLLPVTPLPGIEVSLDVRSYRPAAAGRMWNTSVSWQRTTILIEDVVEE